MRDPPLPDGRGGVVVVVLLGVTAEEEGAVSPFVATASRVVIGVEIESHSGKEGVASLGGGTSEGAVGAVRINVAVRGQQGVVWDEATAGAVISAALYGK